MSQLREAAAKGEKGHRGRTRGGTHVIDPQSSTEESPELWLRELWAVLKKRAPSSAVELSRARSSFAQSQLTPSLGQGSVVVLVGTSCLFSEMLGLEGFIFRSKPFYYDFMIVKIYFYLFSANQTRNNTVV